MSSFLLPFLALLFGATYIHAHPPGTLLVSQKDSTGTKYKTIQGAIDALSLTDPAPQHIYIAAGYYEEAVVIPARVASLHIKGATRDVDKDDDLYHGNMVTIARNASQSMGFSNDETATLRVHMNNFTLHNVDVINTYLHGGPKAQALALSAMGDKQSYIGSSFTGYIDVIGNEGGDQFFAGSYIEGAIDMLFGRTGNAYYHDCDFAITSKKHGWLLASGSDNDLKEGALIIGESRIDGKNGSDVKKGSVFLGRPWGTRALSAVQHTYLSEIINSTGWDIWRSNDTHIENANFYEFNNRGPGADGKRADFSHTLQKAIKLDQIFNSTDWINEKYSDL